DELVELHRIGEIVVRAQLIAFDDVSLGTRCRNDDERTSPRPPRSGWRRRALGRLASGFRTLDASDRVQKPASPGTVPIVHSEIPRVLFDPNVQTQYVAKPF